MKLITQSNLILLIDSGRVRTFKGRPGIGPRNVEFFLVPGCSNR